MSIATVSDLMPMPGEDRELLRVCCPWLAKRGLCLRRAAMSRLVEGGFTSRAPSGSCGMFAAQVSGVLGENSLCEGLKEAGVRLRTQF